MSFVEVLPVEPVIATTFAAGSELAPPGSRERLHALQRIGVGEYHPADAGLDGRGRVLGRHEHAPRARLQRR